MSATITLGIDLGTTNSAIALNNNSKYEIIKNSDQMEYTPSVFWYNKGWSLQVWKKAYEQLFVMSNDENVENYKAEVKRLMWTSEMINFPRTGISMNAEEISAEILKYLKESVKKKYPESYTGWVVITVPAYFDTIQKEATKRAGDIAGFEYTVLLQEPIAAAVAYWFDNKINENWLVYDLGGGTFDVAIVSSQEWVLTIKWHGWDNYLGGKDFDDAIVNKIIEPELKSKYDFASLERWNKKVISVYNRLKYLAESAKKELTDSIDTKIVVEGLVDESGKEVYLEIPFSRWQFESTVEKLVDSSISICKNALRESGFSHSDIARVILVGWSTQSPYIRKRLEKDLKIKVDSSVDPLTVVAKGACIFWGSQIIPETAKKIQKEQKIGCVDVQLNYESMTSEEDMMVTWSLLWDNADQEYYIQIQSEDGQYSGNKIKLKNGKFFDTVLVSAGKTNTYFIYLSDAWGNIIPTNPEMFNITHGISIAGTPLSHSIWVALNKKVFMGNRAEESIDVVFPRGSILPLKKTLTYRTTRGLKKWDTENALPIKIYEGESDKADRNTQICSVTVTGAEIPYNLPEGTEVNLTIEINASNEVQISAYFPSIDLYKAWNSMRTVWDQEQYTAETMQADLDKEKERIENLSAHISPERKQEIQEEINGLSGQTSWSDTDTQRKTHQKIKEVKNKIDALEENTKWNRTAQEYTSELEQAQVNYPLSEHPVEFKQIQSLKQDWDTALQAGNIDKLKSITEELSSMNSRSIYNSLEGLKSIVGYFYNERNKSIDPPKSAQIFEKATKCMQSNDLEGLKQCIRELRDLMPPDVQENMSNISGISK